MSDESAPREGREHWRDFGKELDRIRARVEAELGERDVRYVKRLQRVSRTSEVIGRLLIHLSFEPVTFGAGVIALWLHKQLQATEIGHTVLHGAYDALPGAERFRSTSFRWEIPIDLFPKLPPQRLREIAPEVRAVCEKFGVPYRSASWGRTLRQALAWIGELSRAHGAVRGARAALRAMG